MCFIQIPSHTMCAGMMFCTGTIWDKKENVINYVIFDILCDDMMDEREIYNYLEKKNNETHSKWRS